MSKHKKQKASERIAKLATAWSTHRETMDEATRYAEPRQLANRIAAHLQLIEADAEALCIRLHALGESDLADTTDKLLHVVRDMIPRVGQNLLLVCHDVARRYAQRMPAPVDVA
jgi:hypothetical protein